MKTKRTQREILLVKGVTREHPADAIVKFTDTGETLLMDIHLIEYETPEERKAALNLP